MREVRATGYGALMLASELLQRARRADAEAGLWEAADVQWSWRTPRQSDDVEKIFWIDDDGPVAGVLLTSGANSWQCDPTVVPDTCGIESDVVWRRTVEHVEALGVNKFEIPVSDDGAIFGELAQQSGFTAGEQDHTAWMDAADQPAVSTLTEGYVLVDRTQRLDGPHPMQHRNGDSLPQRLGQCPLYDPSLDLAVETTDGRVAGYALFWFDSTTKVGLIEPVRVEDEFQRQGLARVMLAAGIDRLVACGAERVKISYETDAAAALYEGVGFRQSSTTTWYQASR